MTLPETDEPRPARQPTTPYDRVVVIFNPNSTGDAPALAEELRADLVERLPDLPVHLQPTQYAGHARELAGEAARTGRPLVVSVSGAGQADSGCSSRNPVTIFVRSSGRSMCRPWLDPGPVTSS